MSPYVVPDSRLANVQLERNTDNLPKSLTPTFWAELTIVPFNSLGDPARSNMTPNDDISAELSSQESMDAGMTLSKLADPQPPHVPHAHFFFDDGNIIFLVRALCFDASYLLTWMGNLNRSRAFSTVFINISSAAIRVTSRTASHDSPRS